MVKTKIGSQVRLCDNERSGWSLLAKRWGRCTLLLSVGWLLVMTQVASAQLGGWIDKAKQKAQQVESKAGLGTSTNGYEFFYFPATSDGKSVEYYTPVFAAPKQENVITTWGYFRQFVIEKYGAQAISGRNRSYYAQASETLSLDAQKRQRISEARAGWNGFAPAEIVETGWIPRAGGM